MSEGVQDEAGRPLAEVLAGAAVERDAHGNLQLTQAMCEASASTLTRALATKASGGSSAAARSGGG
jgi:hypothetical protein